MLNRWLLRVAVFTLVVGWISSASAVIIRDDVSAQAYLDLGAAPQYASVGQVITDGWFGSGTLIASDWVLTAAHVVNGASNMRFKLNGTTFTAVQSIAYPKWNGNLSAGYDIGLIELSADAAAVTKIAPAQRYTGSSELGLSGTFVGYGLTGTGLTGTDQNLYPYDSQKRTARNVIDVWYSSPKGQRIFGADFDNPHNPADSSWGNSTPQDLEGLIAPGDSGGGVFIDIDGVYLLAASIRSDRRLDGNVNSDYGDRSGTSGFRPSTRGSTASSRAVEAAARATREAAGPPFPLRATRHSPTTSERCPCPNPLRWPCSASVSSGCWAGAGDGGECVDAIRLIAHRNVCLDVELNLHCINAYRGSHSS